MEYFNHEHYPDPTPYYAMRRLESKGYMETKEKPEKEDKTKCENYSLPKA